VRKLSSRVRRRDERHIRVLVRTTKPQRATLFGDLATLRMVTAPVAQETHAITTYNSDGAILSPTIQPDGSSAFGDNQANYAVSGPDRLANGSFEKPSPLGGVQGGTLTRADGFSRSLGLTSALLATNGNRRDEGWYSDPVLVEPGQKWSFSVWLQGAQQAEKMLVGMWLYKNEVLRSPVGNLNFSVTLSGRPGEYIVTGVVPPGPARYVRGVVRTRPWANTLVLAVIASLLSIAVLLAGPNDRGRSPRGSQLGDAGVPTARG